MCSIASCNNPDQSENKFGARLFTAPLSIGGFGVSPNTIVLPPEIPVGGFGGVAIFYYVQGPTGAPVNPPYVWSTTVAGASALSQIGLVLLPTGVLQGIVSLVPPTTVVLPIRATDCKGCHVDGTVNIVVPPL